MSYAVFHQLAPAVVNEAVAELVVDNESLQNLFGGQMNGPNVKRIPGRNFGWDVFNPTREVASARLPGTGPSRSNNQPVDVVTGRFPRVHESIPLLGEEVHNQRRIGGQPGELDTLGQSYITEQEQILKQRVVNHREFQFAAMLRGSYTYSFTGDDLIPAFTGGSITINFRVPTCNLSSAVPGLDPNGNGNIITAAWSTAGTKILDHLFEVDKQMKILTGKRLKHVVCNASVWKSVTNNTQVQASAGTANVYFDRLEQVTDGSEDFTAVLRGCPWVLWHINNEVLNLNGTVTQMIQDDYATFLPNVAPTWIQYWEGSEPVCEWVGRPWTEQYGAYFYATPTANPAGYELISLMNGLPAPKNPKAIMTAKVQ
jgi:hypothetical protein